MKAAITTDTGEFFKLGDPLLRELKPKKLPQPKFVWPERYPKRQNKSNGRKRINNKSFKRQQNRMKKSLPRGF